MLLRPRRVLRLLILIAVASYWGVVLYGALWIGYQLTVPLTGQVCCLALEHEDIHFDTADGQTLAGWYIPPKNGVVIILVHAYYSDRRQTTPVAEMLARHGYGLLMYDQRASGESTGDARSFGWRDIPDVRQAVAFALSHSGVKKLGVYGCSMGGAIALAGAAQNPSIGAVVADAPSNLSFDEGLPRFDSFWVIDMPIYLSYFSFIAVRTQALPPMSTQQAVQAIAPRPLLLISSGSPGESQRVDRSFAAAGPGKSRWNIPQADHCGGPIFDPTAYEQHLADFFDSALKK